MSFFSKKQGFAHKLECWNTGFWENGKLGYCKIPIYGN